MPDQPQRGWKLVDTIGPVFSDLGLRNWDLCLAREAVIACPRSLWLTVKTGILAGLGKSGAMQRVWVDAAGPSGERVLQDAGDPGWRRYALPELESVTVKRCSGGANEIRVKRRGAKPHIYGLGDRDQTDKGRAALRRLYPGLYREENF
jgi:hypothetical protein